MKASLATYQNQTGIRLKVHNLSQAIIELAYANAKTDGVIPLETDPLRGNLTFDLLK